MTTGATLHLPTSARRSIRPILPPRRSACFRSPAGSTGGTVGGDDDAAPASLPLEDEDLCEDRPEGRDLGVVEVVAAEEVLDDDPAFRQARLGQREELLRRHVGGDVVGIEGVEPDLIVALPAFLEELAAVVDGQRLAGRDAEAEILLRQLFHEGVHLDRLELDLREVHPEDRRDVAPAEADQADLLRIRPEEETGEHHRGVFEDGGVRLLEIEAGLAQVALAAEDHAPLHAVLADGDVVVDGVALVKDLLTRGGLRRSEPEKAKDRREG